jgi:glycosyltransferase involved in cell wall biosynthesis
MPSLCITLTSPFVLNAFLLGHVRHLSREMRVTVCVNLKESDIPIDLQGCAELHPVEIRRKISVWKDLCALDALRRFYRDRQFDAVFTMTPKGGLLGMLAARWVGVPVRVHCFTGQVWSTRKGLARHLLKLMDKVIALSSTHLLADSASQRDFLISEKVVPAHGISVLGSGSVSGVDSNRFRPDPIVRERLRTELGIPRDSVCLLYVGRMKKEKGVLDLLEAFRRLSVEHVGLQLLLVGPDEEKLIAGNLSKGVHVVGYTKSVELYMAAADVICLPSYREGFGSVLIEAASAGLPAVASRIYGITDAVVDGKTGFLHQPGDTDDLTAILRPLLESQALRLQMSARARRRAVDLYSSARVEELLGNHLLESLKSNSGAQPLSP